MQEERLFPVIAATVEQLPDTFGLAGEAFDCKGRGPQAEAWINVRAKLVHAGYPLLILHHLQVPVIDAWRESVFYHERLNGLPVPVTDRVIIIVDNMKDHMVIGRIGMMPVPEPVGGFHVKFNITGPGCFPYPEFCIEKVRPAVAVLVAGVDNGQQLPRNRPGLVAKVPVLPDVGKKRFIHDLLLYHCFPCLIGVLAKGNTPVEKFK